MKLITDVGNQHFLKVLITSKVSGISLELQFVERTSAGQPSSFVSTAPYLKRNVLPLLTVDADFVIHSPNAICRYLLSQSGKDIDDLEVDEWLEWEATSLQCALGAFLAAIFSGGKGDEEGLKSCFSNLDKSLVDKTFLVGGTLSAADICIFSALYPLQAKASKFIDKYASLATWISSLSSLEVFQAAVSEFIGGKGSEALKKSILGQPLINVLPSARPNKESSKVKAKEAPEQEEPQAEVFSAEVLAAAKETFFNGHSQIPKPQNRQHPVLPEEGRRNILITSALPYVNNVPHLGTIIGCVLSADVFSRFCRLRNYNVLYICGTDEYGTATETKALEEGLTPQQICDKYFKLHDQVYKWFNIDFDYFGRTTTQQQTVIAQDIFWKLHNNGHLIQDSVEQLKCESCQRYLADRFVEGVCPLCNYDDARGDQCDKCGKLINATELKNPRCKICSKTPVVKSSQHLFLDLPKLEPKLKEFLEKSTTEGDWTSNAKLITSSWIRDGLKPRCITRDLKWGTPVPLEGYTDKVFYVWFDAPIGYPSITANYTDQWEKWWKNPQQVSMYNFMAKDNVPFHSVVFPCSLLGADDNWSLVNHLIATEYLNYEDTKFSKSRGIGVFGDHAAQTGIPADIWRFYLLFIRPESQDSAFSWADFVWKNNSELLNNLGNFINRGLKFLDSNFGGVVPALDFQADDCQLLAAVEKELKEYMQLLEKVKIRDAIKNILNISRLGNQHIQANQPWVLVKGTPEEKARAGSVIGLTVNISCLLSVMLQPYMPDTSKTIQDQLNAPPEVNVLTDKFVCHLKPGHKIGTPNALFAKIESQQADDLRKRFAGRQEKVPSVTKKEEPKLATATSAPAAANPAEIERLTKEAAKQGDIVRELKAAKAEKAKIDEEVQKLLALKRELAIASGEDPNAGKKSKAKKGKKK